MIIQNKRATPFNHMSIMLKEILPPSADTAICVGPNMLNIDTIKKKYKGIQLIAYNFEQLYDRSIFLRDAANLTKWYHSKNDVFEYWDYDFANIEYAKKYFNIESKYKPLVYCESLKTIKNNMSPKYDVLFYGWGQKERVQKCEWLSKQCPQLKFNFYLPKKLDEYVHQDQLDEMISNTKIVLCLLSIHDIQQQSRIFYNLINNKCIVSEKCSSNMYGNLIVETDTNDLPNTLNHLIKSDEWNQYSQNASSGFKQLSNQLIQQYWK